MTSVINLLHRANGFLSMTDQLTAEDVTQTASIMDLCVTSGADDVFPLKSDLGQELVAMVDNILKMEEGILDTVQSACTRLVSSGLVQYYF